MDRPSPFHKSAKMATKTTSASYFSDDSFDIFDDSGSKDDFEEFSLVDLEQEVT